jgi:3-hydroxyacyl-CoA dehydrogenase
LLNSQDKPADAETFVKETLSQLHTSLDLKDAVKNSDLVVEAIVENLDLKHKLFSSIDSVCIILIRYHYRLFLLMTNNCMLMDLSESIGM